jgi:hypothetical protein
MYASLHERKFTKHLAFERSHFGTVYNANTPNTSEINAFRVDYPKNEIDQHTPKMILQNPNESYC